MAFYTDEEEIWKCPQHPSKRRKTGICPTCLRDRLNNLCPDCAHVRPCTCCTTASSSSGESSVHRVSNLISNEPSFRRSRSLAVPFFRSRFPDKDSSVNNNNTPPPSRNKSSFWSAFMTPKRQKVEGEGERKKKKNRDEEKRGIVEGEENKVREERERMMMRSKSVGMALFSRGGSGGGDVKSGKGKGWNFPSPMKALRLKASKISQDRSPLYRG